MHQKKGSVFALVFIAALILIAFASVYLAFMKTTFFDKHNPFHKAPTQATTSATTNTTSDETANWKTYTDSKYKFSFQYPPNWREVPPIWIGGGSYLNLIGLMPQNKVVELYPPPIWVGYFKNPDNLSLRKWQEQQNTPRVGILANFISSTTKTTTINGNSVYINENTNCEPNSCDEVIIMGKGGIFLLYNLDLSTRDTSQYTKAEIEMNKKISKQILSTFKLTD